MEDEKDNLRRLFITLIIIVLTSFVTYRLIDLSNQKAEEEKAKQELSYKCDELYSKFAENVSGVVIVYRCDPRYEEGCGIDNPEDDIPSLKEYVAKCLKPNY